MLVVETRNDLTEEVGGYENVAVLRTIKVVDGDLIEAVQKLPLGTVHGDCILYFKLTVCFGILFMEIVSSTFL